MVSLYDDFEASALNYPEKACIVYSDDTYSYQRFFDLVLAYKLELSRNPDRHSMLVTGEQPVKNLAKIYALFAESKTATFIADNAIAEDYSKLDRNNKKTDLGEYDGTGPSSNNCDPNVALQILTSGTTSDLRKLVKVTHENIHDCAAFMNKVMAVNDEIKELICAPLDHMYGFGRLHSVLMVGGTVHLMSPRSSASSIFSALKNGCNSLSIIPPIFKIAMDNARHKFEPYKTQVRWIQTGAMRINAETRNNFMEIFPNAKIGLHYGMSELMRATMLLLPDEKEKIHTEGKPRPGVQIRTLGECGMETKPGIAGEIAVKGSCLASGYDQTDAWRKRFNKDGWFLTRDIGTIDRDGYLVYQGRVDDVINYNGLLVHPSEIEAKLDKYINLPFCVFGMNDPAGTKDQILALCVETDDETYLQKIKHAIETAGVAIKNDNIFSIARFPKTESGKIQRRRLNDFISPH